MKIRSAVFELLNGDRRTDGLSDSSSRSARMQARLPTELSGSFMDIVLHFPSYKWKTGYKIAKVTYSPQFVFPSQSQYLFLTKIMVVFSHIEPSKI
jgi:hypothetical protein